MLAGRVKRHAKDLFWEIYGRRIRGFEPSRPIRKVSLE
jgi:hypothetical protein